MFDTQRLRNALKNFTFYSSPSSADNSALATVGDINKLIKNINTLMDVFINEIENS